MQELFLKTFPALAGRMGKRNLPALLAEARLESVPPGGTIIHDMAAAESLYLVVEGVCRVYLGAGGRSLLLGRLGKGQWLGEISLLSGGPATSTVLAESEVRLLVWPHEVIHRLRESNPEVAGTLVRELVDALSERVRASNSELQEREGDLALKGSEVLRARIDAPQRSWLRRVLEKLSGTSESDDTASGKGASSPGEEGGA